MSEFAPRLSWPDFVYHLKDLLRAQDIQSPLYLVGGAVRDAYLGRNITDIDIAVDGDAIGLARRVADWLEANIYVMDRDRGVARVFVDRRDGVFCLDFAGLRGETLEADLRDRDFTINAMAVELLGDLNILIDPLEGGLDLRQKVLRRCSPQSIEDDPIRALRAIRLSTQFGLKIHPETLADVKRCAGTMQQTSAERIRDEFFKLLGLDNAARALRVMRHLGMLSHIIPQDVEQPLQQQSATGDVDALARSLPIVERTSAILTAISARRTDNTAAAFDMGMLVIQLDRFRASLQSHLDRLYGNGRRHAELVMLAALLLDTGGADVAGDRARAVADQLKLTADERKKLATAVGNLRLVTGQESWTTLERHRFWYRLGESGIDVILLAVSDFLGKRGNELDQSEWLELVEAVTILLDTYFNSFDDVVKPPLLLDGNAVKQLLGIESGPLVGRMLTALREAQVSGAVLSVDDARDFILKHAESAKK